ncbi:MAG: matrixin family metalloprotease [Actinomycetota bacterium]|nr:matrixin family metalloprotease [Actinomycetota bacterium]
MAWKDRQSAVAGNGLGRRRTARMASAAILVGAAGSAAFTSAAPAAGSTPKVVGTTADTYNAPRLAGLLNGPLTLNKPIVGMATTPGGKGYWLVAADGGVFTFGNAVYYGSMGGTRLNQPIVGMAATPDGKGYWLVAADGGIFSFGNASFYGSMGGTRLNQPVVGMAATPDGNGYWLVAADGGIFSFGNASFYGSMGGTRLNQPIVGMAADPATGGYWMVAADGGIFSFDATFYGSMGATPLNRPVVGMAATSDGKGYWMVAADGGIFSFGNASFEGSESGQATSNVVGMAASGTNSYYMAGSDGSSYLLNPTTPQTAPSIGTSNSASLVPYTGTTWNTFGLSPDNNITFPSSSTPIDQSAPASGSYGFLVTEPNSSLPVRYNPCATIHYVVNVSQAPSYGLQLVQNAFQEISQATGIQFAFDGTTTELPTSTRSAYVNGSPNPILVAWEANGQTDYLPQSNSSGTVVGMGGSVYIYNSTAGQFQYVSGQAAISSTYPLTENEQIHLVLHELGHVIGLGHTSWTNQIMYPVDESSPITYGSGDLRGLAELGMAEGCLP